METISTWEFRESLPDPGAYFSLFESTGWNQQLCLSASELQAARRGSWRFLTAYDGGQLVGTGRIISDGVFHGLIVDVIVSPAYQRRGLGTAIMQRLLAACRDHRLRDVQLFCAAGKAPFYAKLGFVPRTEDAPGMDFASAVLTAHGAD